MKGHELTRMLHAEFGIGGTADGLIVVQDVGTGLIYRITDIATEYHDGGSVTTFIKVEEW